LILAGALLAASCSGGSPNMSAGDAPSTLTVTKGKPNILFVLTDDMRLDELQHMPRTKRAIAEHGMTFDNQFDNVTLCCPARMSILRGQYSHNTGVLTNGGTNGGFETAYATKVEESTLATAMHDAGYTTGLFGKYLNGYPHGASPSYVPPGWDRWSSASRGHVYDEFNYTLNQNGTQVRYAGKPVDYGTDVYSRQTTDFIDHAHGAGKPFFAYLSVYAPHAPATPAPQDAHAFPGLRAPRDASYNEADVGDKPQFIRGLPRLSHQVRAHVDALARKRAQSLQAVDRDVAALVAHLGRLGVLDNTYVMFTSDNGFHLGEHRMKAGKRTAYETDIHLPLLVRGPGVRRADHIRAITGNIDLAPTIAALGGATSTHSPDGRSLAPFLHGQPPNPKDWRQAYLLEHWTTSGAPRDRSGAAQLEPDDLDQTGAGASVGSGDIPEYQGIRVAGYTYVEYATGEKELYNLTSDPQELDNLAASADPALLALLHQRLDKLRSCKAGGCQAAEDEPLNLPS
jgi:arylsulfatase A-like enzyme